MERYTLVQTATTSVVEMGEGLFCVESLDHKSSYYMVDFAKPNCTLFDFQRYKLSCKHFCFIFIHYPEWRFNKLNESYQNHPVICLDRTNRFGSISSCSADANPVLRIPDETGNELPTNEEDGNTPITTSVSKQQDARELAKEVINLTYNNINRTGAVGRTIID